MAKSPNRPLVCLADYEREAQKRLDRQSCEYYFCGAGKETSLRENELAFSRLLLRWRTLRGIESVDLSMFVLGKRVELPIGVAPTATQCMAHPDGELATARACRRAGAIMTLATMSTRSLEDVASTAHATGAHRWFQLYMRGDSAGRRLAEDLVTRAERHGYTAVVVTVDCPKSGKRLADCRRPLALPEHLEYANFSPEFGASFAKDGGERFSRKELKDLLFGRNISWDDIKWICSISRLPVIVKGVMTCEDALEAANCGVKGVWVSNHGARQLDTTPATIEALPEVVAAVSHRCEVYVDGGVRSGTDILKALAFGANAVFVGRPALWGLACDGQQGVEEVLHILKEELSLAMVLCGIRNIKEIPRGIVVHAHQYRSRL